MKHRLPTMVPCSAANTPRRPWIAGILITLLTGTIFCTPSGNAVEERGAITLPGFRVAPDRPAPAIQAAPGPRPDLAARYGNLPIRFEPNVGQAPDTIEYLARTGSFTLGLTQGGAEFRYGRPNGKKANALLDQKSDGGAQVKGRLSFHWDRAWRNVQVQPERPEPSFSNYFIGNDPSRWHAGVANYAAVRYSDLYPGIDWVVYGNPQELEYDLVVAPHADPSQIRLTVEGADRAHQEANGDLVFTSGSHSLRQQTPVVFQDDAAGRRHRIPGSYRWNARDRKVTLVLGAYDHSRTLTIDPTLTYSTYLGGTMDDYAEAIAVDGSGNAYIAGYTTSSDFPTANPEQPKSGGGTTEAPVCSCDAFVAELNAAGTGLVYATYLGGTGDDYGQAIAVDSSGNAYVAGYTVSVDFPTAAAQQSANAGGGDAFLTKISAGGGKLVYSTYLGGAQSDMIQGVTVDSSGSAYVAGITYSTDFPTAPTTAGTLPGMTTSAAEQTANAGGYDAFAAKYSADGSSLVYSTYLGGTGDDYAYGIAVDSAGSAYITGDTTSTDYPTKTPEQAATQDNYDSFVTKMSADGKSLVYSTYLGGFENDHAKAIAVDASGSAYVAGFTVSTNFPTMGPEQAANAGDYDAFLTKFSADGTKLVYSTYLGGSGNDYAYGIALDKAGDAYVTGYTASGDFPTMNPLQAAFGGGTNDCVCDAFVAEFGPSGDSLVFSTYLGGSGDDYGYGIAVDGASNAYVAGYTNSTDFRTVDPFQAKNAGSNDAFITKIAPGGTSGGTSGGTATGGTSTGGGTSGGSTGGSTSGSGSSGGTSTGGSSSGGTSGGGTASGGSSGSGSNTSGSTAGGQIVTVTVPQPAGPTGAFGWGLAPLFGFALARRRRAKA